MQVLLLVFSFTFGVIEFISNRADVIVKLLSLFGDGVLHVKWTEQTIFTE